MLPPYGPAGNGTITGVTAGTGLSGGGSSGTVTVNVAAGGVTATQLGASSVTAAKLAAAQKRRYFVLGRNGAGPVTLTGALVGDKLDGAVNLAAGPGASLDRTTAFEATITVANQIQQTSASDLSSDAIQFDIIRSGT